ncbi:hypothetical protein JW978_03815 [Candidatus Dojkabacteria bacterium]|nr:hypothetical protein [Candidatus Dojkabacteria bacterium]
MEKTREQSTNEDKKDKIPKIIDRALNVNRRIDNYWRKGVMWFWGVLLLFIVLYIFNILFTAIGL